MFEKWYTLAEVIEMLGGVTRQRVSQLASEYGITKVRVQTVFDKSGVDLLLKARLRLEIAQRHFNHSSQKPITTGQYDRPALCPICDGFAMYSTALPLPTLEKPNTRSVWACSLGHTYSETFADCLVWKAYQAVDFAATSHLQDPGDPAWRFIQLALKEQEEASGTFPWNKQRWLVQKAAQTGYWLYVMHLEGTPRPSYLFVKALIVQKSANGYSGQYIIQYLPWVAIMNYPGSDYHLNCTRYLQDHSPEILENATAVLSAGTHSIHPDRANELNQLALNN